MKNFNGTVAILVYENKVLMMLRDENTSRFPGRWAFIGGKVEQGENPFETMQRECKEEIGIVPEQLVDIGGLEDDGNNGWEGVICKFFFSHLSDDEASRIVKGEEGQKIEFKTFKEVLVSNAASLIFLKGEEYVKKLKEMMETQTAIPFNYD